jgi:hypothetical protein
MQHKQRHISPTTATCIAPHVEVEKRTSDTDTPQQAKAYRSAGTPLRPQPLPGVPPRRR